MNAKLFRTLAGVGLTLLAAASARAEVDAESLQLCADCHGEDGISTETDVPTIAGMSSIYLADNMLFYRDEERPCIESKFRSGDTSRAPTTMCEIASRYSEAELTAMAEHFGNLPFVRARQDFDASQVALGKEVHDRYCEKCHEQAGSFAEDDAGLLAGQRIGYLRHSMAEYAEGKRAMIEKMEVKFEKINAEDIEALVNYYAAQQ